MRRARAQKGSTCKLTYAGRVEGAEEDFDSTFDKVRQSVARVCRRGISSTVFFAEKKGPEPSGGEGGAWKAH